MLKIQKNIKLADCTTFKIGGPARFFAEIDNEEDLIEALKYAQDNNLNFFILGGGSNILVSDKGFDGIIIKIINSKFKILDSGLECDAGVSLCQIVSESANNGLAGLEWAAGIPGTIGGAIRGNARAFGKCMGAVIESVKAFDADTLKIIGYNNKECEFTYWGSIFKKNSNLIILSAKIKSKKGDREKIQQEIKNIISKRMAMQPREISPGSFFLNPVVTSEKLRKEFEMEKNTKCKGGKIPAGWLIEEAGFKGKKIGGAMVSKKHANFIINTGNATAEDVIILAGLIKQQVRDKLGVELQEEVQFIGF